MIGTLVAVGIHQFWYLFPLIIVFSLVYAATRHEHMRPILAHSLRFGVWVTGFMAIILAILQLISSRI